MARTARFLTTYLPDALILLGAALAIAGLYLLAGVAWALLVSGLLLGTYGIAADLRWSR